MEKLCCHLTAAQKLLARFLTGRRQIITNELSNLTRTREAHRRFRRKALARHFRHKLARALRADYLCIAGGKIRARRGGGLRLRFCTAATGGGKTKGALAFALTVSHPTKPFPLAS
jgi:hypothetical protein